MTKLSEVQKRKINKLLFPTENMKINSRRQEISRGFIQIELINELLALGISKRKTKLILETYLEE